MTSISTAAVQDFLAQTRLAVVGASDAKGSFGGTIYGELRDHGYDVVAVNPGCETVAGAPCYPTLGDVPAALDGVIVMVNRDAAVDVVGDCVTLAIPRVWLFKGLGSPGAVSEEAVRLCQDNDITVIPGACPLMFLDPVGLPHRIHRGVRRLKGALAA
jgi:predicted CoA-binding protein